MRTLAPLLIAMAMLPSHLHAEPVALVFPDGASVRIELDVDGQPQGQAWHAFLDRLFRRFDRNDDGKLDAAEVGRMFPLPLPDRKTLAMNFAAMDADKDGAVSLAEFKSYCEKGGFTPIVVVFESASVDDARLAKLLLDEFDTNRDGKLSAAELARFPSLLDKYDRNDDERLRLDDLLAAAGPAKMPTLEPGLRLRKAPAGADSVVRLRFGKAQGAALDGDHTALSLVADPHGLHRLHGPGGSWIAGLSPARQSPEMKTVRDFLLVQFDAARGDRASLALADVDDDPALSGFRSLLPFADRDGDGRLTRQELLDHLDLVELAANAQIWIRVRDHGRNPFPILDADADGKLDVREVRLAPAVLSSKGDRALPRSFRISFVGPMTAAIGGVALPPGRSIRPAGTKTSAPAWFVAMDRNGDGWISPREFLGPPQLFRELDTDGDGLLSPAEAARRR